MTNKQAEFTAKYLETGNGVQSALAVYDTDKYEVANAIAVENLQKPTIRAEIDKARDKLGYTAEYGIKRLKWISDSSNMSEVNKALRTGFEVMGAIGARQGNVHIDNRTQQAISVQGVDVARLESIIDRIQDMSKGKRVDAKVKPKLP